MSSGEQTPCRWVSTDWFEVGAERKAAVSPRP